jgi:hypothetical protein
MKGSQPDTAEEHTNRSLVSRRTFMRASAGTAIAAATAGQATAQDTTKAADTDVDLDFSADVTHKPWTQETVTVAEVDGDMGQLQYVADDGEVADYQDHGYAVARRPENDSDVPVAHNPVTLDAASIDGDEYAAFPRGATYDDDADSSTDEVAVEWHEADHWSTSNATNGSISVSEGDRDSLTFEAAGMISGETVKATFDLSSVASSDATITEGMSRKFLQLVQDLTLPTSSTVEFALIDSAGSEVTVVADPSGDGAAVDVIATTGATAHVAQPRVGDVEDKQGVTLDDIQQVEVRLTAAADGANAATTVHGLNVQRETAWTYGDREFVNSDDELETETVEEPSGEFSIVSLASLRDGAFADATVRGVTYSVEQRADKLPDSDVLAREVDASRYDYDHRLEVVCRFEGPTAYDLSRSISKFLDEQLLPSSRYLTVEVATGVGELDDWDDVDSVSWTSKGSSYDSLDKKIELLTGLAVADEGIAIKLQFGLDAERFDAMTDSGPAVAVGASSGGGLSGKIDRFKTILMGLAAGGAIWFRSSILGFFGSLGR